HREFLVSGILGAADSASVDPDLTPFVDGVTNVDSFDDWDQPFKMDMDRITDRDDEYWAIHRATPKAFISPETANELWSSRFGRYTSIRIAGDGRSIPAERMADVSERLGFEIRQQLNATALGLIFQPVREQGLQAAVGANDFSQLFLGFSFFLIVSAILLAGLMFQLGIQQRLSQLGLLQATGFTDAQCRRLMLIEGIVVAFVGAILGAALGVACARGMIYGLTTWWIDATGTTHLIADVRATRLITAGLITIVMAGTVIWNALRMLRRRSARELLFGSDDDETAMRPAKGGVARLVSVSFVLSGVLSIALPVATMQGYVPNREAFEGIAWPMVCFFVAGFALLITALTFLSRRLKRRAAESISGRRLSGLFGLAMANAARNRQRTVLTTALIAFAVFVIVTVAACRRNPVGEAPDSATGNGGFRLVAESAQPILFDLNSAEGRLKLELDRTAATTIPAETVIYGFSMKPGQDASCLNLFQTQVPTLLGADTAFIERGGFRFANTPGDHPWNHLNESLEETDGLPTIGVIGDVNTLQYSLKKRMGDVILYPNSSEPRFALKVVGMLDASIFQGVLVMEDSQLKRVAPDVSGDRYFLVEAATHESAVQTATALETALAAYGMDTEPVSQRLAAFLSVQNTYL
ncbi:MAG: FtsX-like permease family protein, partial [Planctomycetaceae bacterium]|nr:FtsX-like permease family protein [Planctomycetaceae bacterium]